jgi:hypothetical protein
LRQKRQAFCFLRTTLGYCRDGIQIETPIVFDIERRRKEEFGIKNCRRIETTRRSNKTRVRIKALQRKANLGVQRAMRCQQYSSRKRKHILTIY